MASSMDHSLLVFLLFLALSLHIHARESQFFSKTSRFETSSIAEEPSMVLPLQSHNGYGRDPGHSPSATSTATKTNYNTNTNNAAYREPETVPSTFTNAEFSTESYQNKERNYPDNIPSSFNNNAEFSAESYESKERNYGDHNVTSSFTAAEYSTANNYVPSTFSDEEFNRGSYETKVPKYSNYDRQYGMSDTRFLENGKYFYDVNAERSSREYEPMKGNSERYGSYEYKNEEGEGEGEGGHLSNQEKKEMQEDYVP